LPKYDGRRFSTFVRPRLTTGLAQLSGGVIGRAVVSGEGKFLEKMKNGAR
jgi:hypothetical protein